MRQTLIEWLGTAHTYGEEITISRDEYEISGTFAGLDVSTEAVEVQGTGHYRQFSPGGTRVTVRIDPWRLPIELLPRDKITTHDY